MGRRDSSLTVTPFGGLNNQCTTPHTVPPPTRSPPNPRRLNDIQMDFQSLVLSFFARKDLPEQVLPHHCWERVTQAVWRKYPNDLNPNVKTMDVLDRHVDEQGRLHTTRLVGSEGFLPLWVCNMIGVSNLGYAYEHSVVDPVKKTMIMQTRNVTLSGWVDVDETMTYSQHQDNDKTRLDQDTVIKVFGISFKDYCESLIKNTMVNNASKGRQAMEMVITKINKEVQDLATNIEQATSRLNSEFEQATSRLNTELEQAKHGLEQATIFPQAFCEGSSSTSPSS